MSYYHPDDEEALWFMICTYIAIAIIIFIIVR